MFDRIFHGDPASPRGALSAARGLCDFARRPFATPSTYRTSASLMTPGSTG
jgi:hypothetical protein